MPISQSALEDAIRAAIPCDHLEVLDESNGCGENYAVVVVSAEFEGKTTLNRHRFSAYSTLLGGILS
jgi:stress-induced morphogen